MTRAGTSRTTLSLLGGAAALLLTVVPLVLGGGAVAAAAAAAAAAVPTTSPVGGLVAEVEGLLAGAAFSPAVTESDDVAGGGATATTTTVFDSGFPSPYGQPVTFVATVAPTDGGGTVSFYADGAPTPVAGCDGLTLALEGGDGQAYCTTGGTWQPGSHTLTATYSGDDAYAGSSGTVTQTVNGIPTELSATPALLSLSPFGEFDFYLTATLVVPGFNPAAGEGMPITFSAGGMTLGVAYTSASGVATLPVSENLPAILAIVGQDGYSVAFGGTALYLPSAATGPLLSL